MVALPTASPEKSPPGALRGVVIAVILVLAVIVGMAMGAIAVRHAAALGSDAPFVHDLLALDGATGGVGAVGGALDSWSQFVFFALLLWATAAGVLLVLGAVAVLLGSIHRDAALRLTRTGLWLSLLLCLAAMIPLEGVAIAQGWEAAIGEDAGAASGWDPVFRNTALAAGAGLLLLATLGGGRAHLGAWSRSDHGSADREPAVR